MKKIFILLAVLAFSNAYGAKYHLWAAATGTGDGSTKENAYTSLSAIDGILTYGDTVLCWAGTYTTALDFTGLIETGNPYVVFYAVEAGVNYDAPTNAITLNKGGVEFYGWFIQTFTSGYFLADGNYVNGYTRFRNCGINNRYRFSYRNYLTQFYNCLIDFGSTSYPIYFNRSVEFYHTTVLDYYFALFDPASTTYPKNYVFDNSYFYSDGLTAKLFQDDLPNLGTGGTITAKYFYYAGTVSIGGLGVSSPTIQNQAIGVVLRQNWPNWVYNIGAAGKGKGENGYDIGCLWDNGVTVWGR